MVKGAASAKYIFHTIRLNFNYWMFLIFRSLYMLFRRKAYNNIDAILEVKPELRNELSKKFY